MPGSQSENMKLSEVIGKTSWPETKASLLWNYPDAAESLPGYEKLFYLLRDLPQSPTAMRLIIRKTFREGLDEEPLLEVVGKDGTLNKELEDFKHLNKAEDSEYGNGEVEYALEFHPWEEWLGMEIDETTQRKYTYPEILAHCLWEMSFMGFDQERILEEKREIMRRVDEIENMTAEERKQKLIPMEEVMKRMEKWNNKK
ncbi:MAG: hypothetical protein HY695_11805 [Deltaproteobacteria bacterium]|nr:hypothetical protein [Deltaproteobacteria bacterium]